MSEEKKQAARIQTSVLNAAEKKVLVWLAELMKHRDAADSRRYHVLAEKFIAKYGETHQDLMLLKAGVLTLLTFILPENLSGTILT